MRNLIILSHAETDIKETVTFYKEKDKRLDIDFINEINASFSEISETPKSFPIIKYDIRKFVIKKFPFCIYYIDRTEAIYILDVFHNKRNPKDWQKRKVK